VRLIPFDRFSFVSSKTQEELAAILSAKIARRQFRLFSKPSEPYVGTASQSGFKIQRVIGYRNSFLPVIVGRFGPRHDGTRIDVVQRLHYVVATFMLFWFSSVIAFLGLVLFGVGVNGATGEAGLLAGVLLPLFMLIFGWALVTGGFWLGARHTKEDLRLLFDARDLPEA